MNLNISIRDRNLLAERHGKTSSITVPHNSLDCGVSSRKCVGKWQRRKVGGKKKKRGGGAEQIAAGRGFPSFHHFLRPPVLVKPQAEEQGLSTSVPIPANPSWPNCLHQRCTSSYKYAHVMEALPQNKSILEFQAKKQKKNQMLICSCNPGRLPERGCKGQVWKFQTTCQQVKCVPVLQPHKPFLLW